MKTAVLIPYCNEAMTIGKVARDFRRELPDATVWVFGNALVCALIRFLWRRRVLNALRGICPRSWGVFLCMAVSLASVSGQHLHKGIGFEKRITAGKNLLWSL